LLLYWFDSGYEDQIANGVTIGAVDVGGLDREGAATQIEASLVTPLQKNVTVRYEDERFKLRPEQLKIRADVDRMVDEAVGASREGNVFSRSLREISGGEVDHHVEPQIVFSQQAVDDFVAGVAANINREAVDASVEPSASSIQPVASETGRTLEESALEKDILAALQDPNDRKVGAEVEEVEPAITTDDLAGQYPTYIVVDRGSFKLRLYENLELQKTYTVAIGQLGYDTPQGLYHIQNKAEDPTWSVPDSDWAGELAGQSIPPGPENPLKARWMGIYNGAGIHGTVEEDSLGTRASHGCIRMSVLDVKDLYDDVPTGAPIYIA
jgi:lipoprotein-anchoring transpeptidase ErfK/SrfK